VKNSTIRKLSVGVGASVLALGLVDTVLLPN
jgi:hypothetical protein